MESEESELVTRAAAGDQAAFRVLVERHAAPLHRVCARITGDAALAEDALQEAFINAWKELPRFEGRAQFSTWLHRIAVNAALMQRRAQAPWGRRIADDADGELMASVPDHAPGPEQLAHADSLGMHAERALEGLTPLERAAFVMRHYDGASIAEVMLALDASENAAKQAIFRAVRKLRAALQPMVSDDGHVH
jgi:RNA polymerase sigma-70 factor (ECF subfamily)